MCRFCDQEFHDLSGHISSIHGVFHCSICEDFFPKNVELNRHVNSKHNGRPSYSCFICDEIFSSKDCLRDHSKQIHKDEEIVELHELDLDILDSVPDAEQENSWNFDLHIINQRCRESSRFFIFVYLL